MRPRTDELQALAAAVRAAPLRPVTGDDFHAVKQADWSALEAERARLCEKMASADTYAAIGAAIRVAGVDDLISRRDKVASAVQVLRALTILQRGST